VKYVEQYFSHLLAGQGKRLQLLWRAGGRSSFQEWLNSHKDGAARRLQRALLVSASLCFRRHVVFQEWPWPLASMVDQRISIEQRHHIARRFWHIGDTCPMCLDQFFGRRLRQKFSAWQQLFDSAWQVLLLEWARNVRISIAGVEFKHARNKRMAWKQMAWQHFSALFVNQEASLALLEHHRFTAAAAARLAAAQQPRQDGDLPAPPRLPNLETKAKSAYELYRLDSIERDKLAGIRVNTATKEHHARMRSAWGQLSVEEREE
jgi:hypothetical protein